MPQSQEVGWIKTEGVQEDFMGVQTLVRTKDYLNAGILDSLSCIISP